MIEHSNSFINNCKIYSLLLTGLFLVIIAPGTTCAQMFSVNSEGPRYKAPQSEFFLGIEPMNVTYEGSADNQAAVDAFAFKGALIRAGYNTSGLSLFLGTGGKITGIDEVSYFDIGGDFDLGLPLYQSKKIKLQIPIRIASRFTNMTNSQRIGQQYDRFRFGSLTLGTGLQLKARAAENLRFEAGAIPGYGFSFASGGFFGGSLGSVAAEAKLYFDQILGEIGVSAGYQYDFRNYNVDESAYDYRMSGHSIQLGITF